VHLLVCYLNKQDIISVVYPNLKKKKKKVSFPQTQDTKSWHLKFSFLPLFVESVKIFYSQRLYNLWAILENAEATLDTLSHWR